MLGTNEDLFHFNVLSLEAKTKSKVCLYLSIIYKSYDKIFYTFIMFRTKVELNQPWNQSGILSS